MLASTEPTTEIIFSLDEGVSWRRCNFTSTPMNVRNVRVSNGWDSRRFILYGFRGNASVLIHMNFDLAFTLGKCDTARNDYELWSPRDVNGNCVLGVETEVMRRKPGRDCYLPENFTYIHVQSTCPCVAEDYECAHCFYRPTLSAPCEMQCYSPGLPEQPHDVCSEQIYWESELGYRLVLGDRCNANAAGATRPKAKIPCNAEGLIQSPLVSAPFVAGVLVFLILCVAIICVLLLWKLSDGFYESVSKATGVDNCLGRYTVTKIDAASNQIEASSEKPDTESVS